MNVTLTHHFTSQNHSVLSMKDVYDTPNISAFDKYKVEHAKSINDKDEYWGTLAVEMIDWFAPFDTVSSGKFEDGSVSWFLNGKTNACFNAVDRHLPKRAAQNAIVWEGDEPTDIRRITYEELRNKVCKIANAMKAQGGERELCKHFVCKAPSHHLISSS